MLFLFFRFFLFFFFWQICTKNCFCDFSIFLVVQIFSLVLCGNTYVNVLNYFYLIAVLTTNAIARNFAILLNECEMPQLHMHTYLHTRVLVSLVGWTAPTKKKKTNENKINRIPPTLSNIYTNTYIHLYICYIYVINVCTYVLAVRN